MKLMYYRPICICDSAAQAPGVMGGNGGRDLTSKIYSLNKPLPP